MENRYDPAKRNQVLKQIGITEDGRKVIDFFKAVETHGLPLDLIIEILLENDKVPDWCGFVEQAIKYNWNLQRTLFRLEVAIIDVFGNEYAKVWRSKMDSYVSLRDKLPEIRERYEKK